MLDVCIAPLASNLTICPDQDKSVTEMPDTAIWTTSVLTKRELLRTVTMNLNKMLTNH